MTATFAKELLGAKRGSGLIPLKVSWAFELAFILAGIWTLMALTGQVASSNVSHPSVWAAQGDRPDLVLLGGDLGPRSRRIASF